MPFIIIIPVFALLSLLILYPLLGGVSQQSKQAKLLTELGLKNKWWGGKTTPFYRWSWRKQSKERVWGERIVKEAFQKSRIWLTRDDISYFEQKCNEFQKYRKVNDLQITTRIEDVVKRTEELENNIRQQVREMLNRIVSTSEGEAKKSLLDSGINLEGKDRILQRYAAILIRRLADKVGFAMLGHHSGGEESTGLSKIHGIEGWERWLAIYKQMITSEASRNTTSSNQMVLDGLVSGIRSGLLKDYEQDIQSHRAFVDAMDKQLDKKHFPLSPDEIEELECVFYTWQFNNEVRFNNADHNRVRQFISRTDLSGRFRLYVIQGLKADFSSIGSLVSSLSRHIVFFGKNGFARAYAADQYHLHLERFLEVFAQLSQQETGAPGILTLSETEIDKRRKDLAADNRGQVLTGKGLDVVDTARMAIQALFDRKKERSIEKRKIEEDVAERRGWLIDFPWDEQNVEVFGVFRNEPFRTYVSINCDAYGTVDFLSNSSSAKRQRVQYFSIVLDSLLQANPFQSLAASPDD